MRRKDICFIQYNGKGNGGYRLFIRSNNGSIAADPLQLRHGDDGCAEVFLAPI